MTKSSKKQIEEDEKKVIVELQKNSGDSIENIAKNCGFSRQKVWRVKKRLEKNKTIWGYSAVVDNDKLDVKKYIILIKRTNKPFSEKTVDKIVKREVRKVMENIEVNVLDSSYVHGPYDWVLSITAKHIKQVKKFSEILHTMFKDYISDLQVLEVVFPIEKSGFDNPNREEFREYF